MHLIKAASHFKKITKSFLFPSLFASLLIGCTPYQFIIKNDIDATVDVRVKANNKKELMSVNLIPGQKFVFKPPVDEIESVEYDRYHKKCSALQEDLKALAKVVSKTKIGGRETRELVLSLLQCG